MAAELKVYYTTATRLPQLEVESGQLIFVKDTKKIYLDMNGIRLGYDSVIFLDRDIERYQVQNPTEGFYFVLENNILWFYKDDWIPVNEPAPETLFFGAESDFPQEGNGNMLYIDDDAIYKWDYMSSNYKSVATKQEWQHL